MDILIQRHARKLLTQYRLRSILSMKNTLDFPLQEWLHKERYAYRTYLDFNLILIFSDMVSFRFRSAIIEDFYEAICQLHAQFRIGFPSSFSPTRKITSSDRGIRRRHTLAVSPQKLGTLIDIKEGLFLTNSHMPRHEEDTKGAIDKMDQVAPNPRPRSNSQTFSSLPTLKNENLLSRQRRAFSLVDIKEAFSSSQSTIIHDSELMDLLDIMEMGKCYSWAMTIASVMLNINRLLSLRMNENFSKDWSELRIGLLKTNCKGYEEFVKIIDEISSRWISKHYE